MTTKVIVANEGPDDVVMNVSGSEQTIKPGEHRWAYVYQGNVVEVREVPKQPK